MDIKALPTFTPGDQDDLRQELDRVRKAHFPGEASELEITWGIPPEVHPRTPFDAGRQADDSQLEIIARAKQAELAGDTDEAVEILTDLHQQQCAPATSCLIRLHQRLGNEETWQSVAAEQNSSIRSQCTPPSSIEFVEGSKECQVRLITIHLSLLKQQAPKFVIRYLIVHEMLHVCLDTSPENPHPDNFLNLERSLYTNRKKALKWLDEHGYDVVEAPDA